MYPDILADWSPWLAGQRQSALEQLLAASYYSQSLNCAPWDYAVEIETLRAAGLTTNDLRWLSAKGLVEHSQERGRSLGGKNRGLPSSSEPSFSPTTSFILTPDGIAFAFHVCRVSPESNPNDLGGSDTPRWDHAARTLWFADAIVKHFKLQAPNQERILSALQEEGWPSCIDDPLPPTEGIESKRRLHDTIFRLNRGQQRRLIRFSGDGSGLAIHWEYVPTRVATDNRATTERV
jgi:hypothetical protein